MVIGAGGLGKPGFYATALANGVDYCLGERLTNDLFGLTFRSRSGGRSFNVPTPNVAIGTAFAINSFIPQ